MTGGSPNSDITAEFAALQRLAGGGPGASAGSGLPAVVTSLASLQKDCSTPLQFTNGVSFPDAGEFGDYYTSVLDQLIGPQPNAGMQLLVTHVTALSDVAQWTTSNYQSAAELEHAGASVVNDRLNQVLANPSGLTGGTTPGQTTTGGQYPQVQNPAGQTPKGAAQ